MATIKKKFKTRDDGTKLYRTYSDTTPYLKQIETDKIYNCWIYKRDEEGNLTNEVDWELSGVVDVENAPYTYEETTKPTKTNNFKLNLKWFGD